MSFLKEFEYLTIQLQAIISATNNFDRYKCIGGGGFGKVYKGELILSNKHTTVAVKRLGSAVGQGNREFWNEILMLSAYKHENIVSLLGFCDDKGEKILVYEYASRRGLDLYLDNRNLTWVQRLYICIGAARGLAYLHDPAGTHQRVLYRDIKSANILLDENWNAKIADLGLSKFRPANQERTFFFSNSVGTVGYCDPLYIESGFLTKESDVYSFGVVLFEVLCGRLCVRHIDERQPLTKLVRKCYKDNNLDKLIYGGIKDEISSSSLKVFTAVAYQCLKRDRGKRPLMNDIVTILEAALKHQIDPVRANNCEIMLRNLNIPLSDIINGRIASIFMTEAKKIIIDTDPGIDDAMAIFLALRSPEITVIGLTTIYGNVYTTLATRNALHLLEVAGRTDIPVAEGSHVSYMKATKLQVRDFAHGMDGLGNQNFPQPKSKAIEKSAAEFLVEQANLYPGEVTVVALGPLTNIALAIQLDPTFTRNIGQIVLLGGNFAVDGSVNPAADPNIFGDPEAADIVFTSGADVLAVGINVTRQVIMKDNGRDSLAKSDGIFARYLCKILDHYFSYHRDAYNIKGIYLHDPTALLATVNPSLMTCTEGVVRVQTTGITRGLTLFFNDQKRFNEATEWSNKPTVKVAVTVDSPAVVKLVMERLMRHKLLSSC